MNFEWNYTVWTIQVSFTTLWYRTAVSTICQHKKSLVYKGYMVQFSFNFAYYFQSGLHPLPYDNSPRKLQHTLRAHPKKIPLESLYSLLVKVARGVFQKVCWNNLRNWWKSASGFEHTPWTPHARTYHRRRLQSRWISDSDSSKAFRLAVSKDLFDNDNDILGRDFHYFFYLYPYLGKWSKLTNMFQRDWNHQLVLSYYHNVWWGLPRVAYINWVEHGSCKSRERKTCFERCQ